MVTFNRNTYDIDGDSTVLGLPCVSEELSYYGKITSTGVDIEDAYYISEININSGSSEILKLVTAIIDVQTKDARQDPTKINIPTISGYPLNVSGAISSTSTEVEDTLTEITLSFPVEIEGVVFERAWKCSGNISYNSISDIDFIVDGEHDDNAVFVVLPSSYSNKFPEVVEGNTIYNTMTVNPTTGDLATNTSTFKSAFLLAVIYKDNMKRGGIIKCYVGY